MSKNKKIHNKLNKLFDDIKLKNDVEVKEDGQTKPAPIAQQREKPKKPIHTRSLSPSQVEPRQKLTIIEPASEGPGNLISIPFQAGDQWNTIQLEQDSSRRWDNDEQNLVRQ